MVARALAVVEDQSEVVAFLSDPASYGGRGTEVERIDTHGAMVFLVGAQAFKLKRAVRFAYMDFSTRARRHAMCVAELALNRRTAPGIYRRVRALTREADGRLAFDGIGEAVDWVVEMARFDQATLLDRLAEAGRLDIPLVCSLADVVADFHDRAEADYGRGGVRAIERVIANNGREFAAFAEVLDGGAAAGLTRRAMAALGARRELIERRRRKGFVRRCHGDLHLRNICLFEGRPTLFDALEFDLDLATTDVLYDLAFLLMDLWHRRLETLANAVLNRYLWRRPEFAGLALMPLFLSCRAGVRAHVSANMAAWQDDAARAGELQKEARAYLAEALVLLSPPPPRLIAIGGLSGSGKSTLAFRLAPTLGGAPGAVTLRSDLHRKRLRGVEAHERLDADGYAEQVTRRVYGNLRRHAGEALAAGATVIVDAVHAGRKERAAIAAVADQAGVPFLGLWLDAPFEKLAQRVSRRVADASDATVAVLERQRRFDLGEIEWRKVSAAGDADEVLAQAVEAIAASATAPLESEPTMH